MNEPLIGVQNAFYSYSANSRQPIHALRGVTLSIQPGEYVAIIGPNGSGKSTLARLLNGLLLPTRGDVWVNGWNTRDASHRRDVRSTVGMVFQSPDNQIVATIVEEDVAFGPENLGVPPPELRERVDWALETVGMKAYRRRAPHLLSGGQKQRVAIAGILAMKPRVLVLDEATALLDPAGRREVLELARRLNEAGTTIIAVTHRMSEAVLAGRVVVLEDGQVALTGTPREVFRQRERLQQLGLDVPEITQLAAKLNASHPGLSVDALTVDEFVQDVAPRLSRAARPAARPAESERPTDGREPGVIRCESVEYTYQAGSPLESVALRGADLTAWRGEIVGIIGQTGSGKSTLIQHLNAILRPQRGSVFVLGRDLGDRRLDKRSLRRQVGLVFQFPEAQLFEQFVGDDVAFAPWQMGLRGEELRDRVRQAMDSVGLPFDAFKDRALFSLSGGERRRAALAGVLAMQPEILVLDEPTAGLDPRGHRDLFARLVALPRQSGMTLVIVSHNMEDIAAICDRVYVLADGRTELEGRPREVFGQPARLKKLGLGVPEIREAIHALRDRGVEIPGDILTVEEAAEAISRLIDPTLLTASLGDLSPERSS